MESFDFEHPEKMSMQDLDTINKYFIYLIDYLKTNLELVPLYANTAIRWIEHEEKSDQDHLKTNIFNFGITRTYDQNVLTLRLSKKYLSFIPFILLREAYYCFIPNIILSNRGICVLINYIVEKQLQNSAQNAEWRVMMQDAMVDYEFLTSELDKIKGLVKVQKKAFPLQVLRHLIEYIRNNSWLFLDSSFESFHDLLLKASLAQSSPLIFNEERIETLRILVLLFYRLKKFSSLTDYVHSFQDLLAQEPNATYLSVRKFESNARLISATTQIAPTYWINLPSIDAIPGILFIRFHPQLSHGQIMSLLTYFPFLIGSRWSDSNFALTLFAYAVIPQVYLKDLKRLLERLIESGYATKALFSEYSGYHNCLNLNYFREFYLPGKLINLLHPSYEKRYILEQQFTHQKRKDYTISMLEYLLLNRLSFYAADGFGFDRDTHKLAVIKLDLLHEIISQKKLIERLKKLLDILTSQPSGGKAQLIQLLRQNQNYGFFYLQELLKNLIGFTTLLQTILKNHPELRHFSQIQEFIRKQSNERSLSDNFSFPREKNALFFIYRFFPHQIEHCDHLIELKETIQLWSELFTLFHQLKIYEIQSILKILTNKDLPLQIFSVKEAKLKSIVQEYRHKKISSKSAEALMETWLQSEPSVIKPYLLNTISTTTLAKYHLILCLKNEPDVMPKIQELKPYCTRILVTLHLHYIFVELYFPNISLIEKDYMLSIVKNLFGRNLLFLQRYFFSGYMKTPSLREFYDLERQRFFYTKDLFPQYFLYVQKICGPPLPAFEEEASVDLSFPLGSEQQKNLGALANVGEEPISKQSVSIQRKHIEQLERFHHQLSAFMIDKEKYQNEVVQDYFSFYVKSIRGLPNLSRFGLSYYYLYIRPTTMKDLDLKSLLSNTFTKVKQTLNIDSIPTLWIESIFPYHNPNTSSLYWTAFSKKIISEFCLFTPKKVYLIFHSFYNLSSHGWDYDPKRFKAYTQKILANPNFNPPSLPPVEYKLDTYDLGQTVGPDNSFYRDLLHLYKRKLPKLNVLLTHKSTVPQKILHLLHQHLIYPYLTIKKAGFQEKLIFIIPSVKKENIDTLIKIFSFFNYVFIYEIEGEFFLYGHTQPLELDSGLMIKLYMPQCEMSEFQMVFAELFHYFQIPNYVILHDLIETTNLLHSIYGSLDFLQKYHPLKNLYWDASAKQWQNPKLFGEKFEKIYPPLIP